MSKSLGLYGWCLPCCLFGKTASRLNDPALKEDSAANGDVTLSPSPPTPSFYVNPITRQNTDPDRLVLHLLPLHLLRPLRDRAHAEARRAAQALRDRGLRAEGLRRLVFLSVLHARAAREGGRGPVRHYAGAVSVAGGDGFFAVGKKFGDGLVLSCRGSRLVRSFPLLLYSMCIDNLNRITYYRPALYFSCSKWGILLNISSCILYKHYF